MNENIESSDSNSEFNFSDIENVKNTEKEDVKNQLI